MQKKPKKKPNYTTNDVIASTVKPTDDQAPSATSATRAGCVSASRVAVASLKIANKPSINEIELEMPLDSSREISITDAAIAVKKARATHPTQVV